MSHIVEIHKEYRSNCWSAAIAQYESKQAFEDSEGEAPHTILTRCYHEHENPEGEPIQRCVQRLTCPCGSGRKFKHCCKGE